MKSVHEEEGISLEEEVEHDNERDGDNVQQKVTMYNISTDGINKKYHQQSTWKKVRRHKEEGKSDGGICKFQSQSGENIFLVQFTKYEISRTHQFIFN